MNNTVRQTRIKAARDGDFGSLIFQAKPSIALGVFLVVIGLGSLLLLLAWLLLDANADANPMIVGLVALASMLFITLGVLNLVPLVGSVFFFYERGVKHVLRRRQRSLRYEDIAELTLLAQRVYYGGAYIGSSERLTIRSSDRHDKPFIAHQSHRETGAAQESDVRRVCWHIARIMASQLAERIEKGEDIAWTDKMRIHAAGIEVRDGTIIIGDDGKWKPNLVPWEKVVGADFDNGMFRLRVEGDRNYRVIVKAASPNFYPGYFYAATRMAKRIDAPAAPLGGRIIAS